MPRGSLAVSRRERNPDVVNQVSAQVQQGHLNCLVQATLSTGVTTTTVTAPTCTTSSAILACPLTADAAADMNSMWFAPGVGQFVVHHANNANVDRTFNFAVLG